MKPRQRRALRRETRELTFEVFEDFRDLGQPFTREDVKKEVLFRREQTQAIFDGLDPETKTRIREFFLKLLDLLLDRLFSQLG